MRHVMNPFKKWEYFNKNKEKSNYPKWPNETMLKIVFGNYLKNKININPGSKVLDVGCGFGNNLLPFLDVGCPCFGTEVTEDMAKQTKKILHQKGFKADIRCGTNAKIPFEDDSFDLLLSIGVIHYEKSEKNISLAFSEYKRVLRNGGRILLVTTGPEHDLFKRSHPLGSHRYEIKNYDFRNGQTFFFFENSKYLKSRMDEFFADVEIGRVKEELMSSNVDSLIGVGSAKK